METKITKAMVLAAGLGTRLRPLTYKTPKPMLELGPKRLIDYSLEYLAHYGIKEVMINLHHLGEQIYEYVGIGKRYGLRVFYSFEPTILGTGGGIKNVEMFFEGAFFVALNSDSLTNADLSDVIRSHFETNADATMVLKKKSAADPYEGVAVKDGLVTGFANGGGHFYTGLQIIGSHMLHVLPREGASCLINDGYKKLLERKAKINAYIYNGYFNDLGTPERYEQAKKDVESGAYKPLIS